MRAWLSAIGWGLVVLVAGDVASQVAEAALRSVPLAWLTQSVVQVALIWLIGRMDDDWLPRGARLRLALAGVVPFGGAIVFAVLYGIARQRQTSPPA